MIIENENIKISYKDQEKILDFTEYKFDKEFFEFLEKNNFNDFKDTKILVLKNGDSDDMRKENLIEAGIACLNVRNLLKKNLKTNK